MADKKPRDYLLALSPVLILIVIAILAAGHFGGCEYADRRSNRRSWK